MNNENQVPAYLVASSFMPNGHGSLDAYGEATHPLMEKYGGELIIAGYTEQEMNQFEGEWKKDARITVFKFPSKKHLMDFWYSPEYQAVKHLRTEAIPPNFTFAVEGYNPALFSYED